MATGRPPRDARDVSLFAFAVGLVLLASPLRALWAFEGAPFWAPFAVWALLIVLGLQVARRAR